MLLSCVTADAICCSKALAHVTHDDLNQARAKASGQAVEAPPEKKLKVAKKPTYEPHPRVARALAAKNQTKEAAKSVAAAKPKSPAKRTGPKKWVQCEHAQCCKWR